MGLLPDILASSQAAVATVDEVLSGLAVLVGSVWAQSNVVRHCQAKVE